MDRQPGGQGPERRLLVRRQAPVDDANMPEAEISSVSCSRTAAGGADEGPLRLLGLANPVQLDDEYTFAADVGQADEH
jgi:hypothetical protein